MSDKAKVGIAIAALLTAFAFGRFTTPVQVKTEIKTVEVERQVEIKDTDRAKHQETTTVEVKKPDGTVETTTKVVLDSHTNQKVKEVQTDSESSDQTKQVTRSSSPVTILALAGMDVFHAAASKPVYGLSVSKPTFGPVTIGIWGLNTGTAGASLGLTF